jgi:hypothetical protein
MVLPGEKGRLAHSVAAARKTIRVPVMKERFVIVGLLLL